MKRFIIIITAAFAVLFAVYQAYYSLGWYVAAQQVEVSSFVRVRGKEIYMDGAKGEQVFEIKGVNLGSGYPGEWATDYAIGEETYARWLGQIQELGANTVRVCQVQGAAFYRAFFSYNQARMQAGKAPLYLIQGVDMSDYHLNCSQDAFSKEIYQKFLSDCRDMVDVIHGKKNLTLGRDATAGSGVYRADISDWVIGYIIGKEWKTGLVAATDLAHEELGSYEGIYLKTTAEASPFEQFLAQAGDALISYETKKYKTQRLLAFSNGEQTDPFQYPAVVSMYLNKTAYVDVEHIQTTEAFLSGQFAAYHTYPYDTNALSLIKRAEELDTRTQRQMQTDVSYLNTCYRLSKERAPKITDYVSVFGLEEEAAWRAYLSALNAYHTMPVLIAEFGISTGRGTARAYLGHDAANVSEQQQGEALIDCCEDISAAGCAGCCVYEWSDEWYLRSWNTMYAVDLRRTPYWSDMQTCAQHFGLLAFDTGEERSVCYVDGDISEWTDEDIVYKKNHLGLSLKYDEAYLYLMIQKEGYDFAKDTLYVPIDLTPKSGSSYCEGVGLRFDRAVDFLLTIHGKKGSKLQVQEYYEALRSTYAEHVYGFDTYTTYHTPDVASPVFQDIRLILQTEANLYYTEDLPSSETFLSGALHYGNGNPTAADFDSLADFCASGDCVEVRLPWQLLNFSDPSQMQIHGDYYDGITYGVDYLSIQELYAGAADGSGKTERIALSPVELKGWGNDPQFHERLKPAYAALQEYWR